ncbi:MAG TPA: PPOX class F420-dependent oxidoreductase [Actinophytocola sp.]|uniref:PPOX class F420-dependent oxidoreductase n=1 Tax=Actinophytocola sp. TaxID=1872138 RepID=UPI002DBE6C1F|nr:PPOX class F420-dependent oxidoreductase [Actinophytocola sp.]HEU5473546.1 PPOX class F420-dependent oxidoreductase [Actinophytocola sp.]
MLTDALRKTLGSPVFATVATIHPDGTPHCSVVWIDRDGDDVLFAILFGSIKERNLRRDNRMTLVVNPDTAPYTYASITGTVTFSVTNRDGFMDRLSYKYTGMSYDEFAPEPLDDHDFVVVRLKPDKIYSILE